EQPGGGEFGDGGDSQQPDGGGEGGVQESKDTEDGETEQVWLDKSHESLPSMGKRRLVDGGPDSLRCSLSALERGEYTPYDSFTQALLANFTRVASPSRSQLGLLFHCLRQTDKDGNGINPADVPDSADHFHRDMRVRSPLFPVYGQDVREKGSEGAATSGVEDASEGPTRLIVSIPAGVVIQRKLDSPGFVEKLLASTPGHTLSESDRLNGRVPDAHVMPIPTRRSDGVRQGAMYGDIAACSSIFGIDSIMVGQGDKEDRVVVGDTVMVVDLPGQAEATGALALPCRLESLVWTKDCDIAGGGSNDRIVARVQPFLLNNDLSADMKVEEDAHGTKTGVWEVTNAGVDLETSKLVGRCEVVVSADVQTGEDGSALPSFRGVGFVKRLRNGRHKPLLSPDPAAKHLPWRPEGAERLFYDRRQKGNHWNDDKERRVFLTPAHLFTDAFDFRNQGGVSYSIKATLLSPFASTSQSFRRQPGAWPLVGLAAPRVRWQDDLGFILEVIGVLQKGCRARLAVADKVEEDFFLDGNYDIVRNRRTDYMTEYALKVISAATTKAQQQVLSAQHGVTPQGVENPFRKHVHMNMVRMFGIDVFHQDAQNSLRKILKCLLGGLSKTKGVPLLSCLAKDPSLRVAGTPPLRDFVSDGGFSALSGMDVWRLSSVALLVFRPVLRSVASMRRLTTAPFRGDIKAELEVTTDTEVLENLRALLLASSEATHLLRSSSFSDQTVASIERSQREKVSLMRMLGEKHGGRLCSNHQGLHFAKNATDYGELSDCHAGESRHKTFKSCAKTASGRDNEEHIVRRENDAMAAEAMAEGVRWTAWGYDKTKRGWVKKTVQASPACRELLRAISERVSGTRRHGTGRPRGIVEWNASLEHPAAAPSAQGWQETIGALLPRTGPGRLGLLDLYKAWFSCGRETSNPNMNRWRERKEEDT
ncbi:unnamed protein product, partial [Ectocarpus fasciculatus]